MFLHYSFRVTGRSDSEDADDLHIMSGALTVPSSWITMILWTGPVIFLYKNHFVRDADKLRAVADNGDPSQIAMKSKTSKNRLLLRSTRLIPSLVRSDPTDNLPQPRCVRSLEALSFCGVKHLVFFDRHPRSTNDYPCIRHPNRCQPFLWLWWV